MKKSRRISGNRRGVILLVVISLLVLFALVGLAFVIYGQSQANIARLWREGETEQRPDMDPELLLSYFVGQLIYDTDNPHSALRGHGLARNMYGKPLGTSAFSGTGRIHTDPDPDLDDYYRLDYTQYGGAARNPDQYGSPNPSYTYPDFNHAFLAAQQASDGAILIPSYERFQPGGKPVNLRPDPAYHTDFPPRADPSGDVRNYADGPGFLGVPPVPVVGGVPYDSIWIDCGFPVRTAADGRRYKPLFAPLILDLDNRVNVNVHGNNMESCLDDTTGAGGPIQQSTYGWGEHNSTQGFGCWEVNLQRVLDKMDLIPTPEGNRDAYEARKIFCGTPPTGYAGTPVRGRYDPNFWDGSITQENNPVFNSLNQYYSRTGPFYRRTDFDCEWTRARPENFGAAEIMEHWSNMFFPMHPSMYANGAPGPECGYHALLYNFFHPELSCMADVNWRRRDRTFSVANLEALLRYGDNGSPSMHSDLFALCPRSFAQGRARRQVTTHAFDLDRPGAIPFFHGTASWHELSALGVPERDPVVFPAPGAAPAAGEFDASWQNTTTALGRINLNRELPNYPAYDQATLRITDMAAFATAQKVRQDLAKEIYDVLVAVTGATSPPNPNVTVQRRVLRWLAQLAVNIVDYRDNDDYLTPFDWTGNGAGGNATGLVYGCELPRLLVNEVYAEIVNTDPANASAGYDVRFWAELVNPLCQDLYLKENGDARLQVPAPVNGLAYAVHRLLCIEASAANTGILEKRDNPLLYNPIPTQFKFAVGAWDPDTSAPQPLVDVSVVKPIGTNAASSPNGSNLGYYVVGPKDHFPGTDPLNQAGAYPLATLRVKNNDQPDFLTAEGVSLRSSMVYHRTAAATNLAALPRHALVLQRLACPHLPPNVPTPFATHDPTRPLNPYVTVDFADDVPTCDGVVRDPAGGVHSPPVLRARMSSGRSQPYAAHKENWQAQAQLPAVIAPQTTFFAWNIQPGETTPGPIPANGPVPGKPFRWLQFADSHLISPMELLHVSAHPPHMLTQKFIAKDAATGNLVPFGHEAPWYDQDIPVDSVSGVRKTSHYLYRFFEFVNAQCIHQGAPLGSRAIGRVNINTIFDKEVFLAVTDPRKHIYYQEDQIDETWQRLIQTRQRNTGKYHFNEIDEPFLGMAAPFTGGLIVTDAQYRRGPGHSTLFRFNWNDPNTLLFDIDSTRRGSVEPKNNPDCPYFRHELLRKTFNNWTARSNVFAVWLTVGFFEVVGDGKSGGPPLLGQELNRKQNRHVRHRMLAIIDRTNVTMAVNAAGAPITRQGPRPWYCHTEGTTIADPVNPQTLRLSIQPLQTNRYEDVAYHMSKDPVTGVVSIIVNGVNIGNRLVIDSGPNQETIAVTDVDGPSQTITAIFTKAHPCWGVPVTNVGKVGDVGIKTVFGNPGPQPRFDCRHPDHAGVVRFISIVE